LAQVTSDYIKEASISIHRAAEKEVFSEARIQLCESLCVRTGAKRCFAPLWAGLFTQLATRLDDYAALHSILKNFRLQDCQKVQNNLS
jgi:hypothetical protein